MDETGQPGAAAPGEGGNGAVAPGDGAGARRDPNRQHNGWATADAAWSDAGSDTDPEIDPEPAQPPWRQPVEPIGVRTWADPLPRYGQRPVPLPGSGAPRPGWRATNGASVGGSEQLDDPSPIASRVPASAPPYPYEGDLEDAGGQRLIVPTPRPIPPVERRPDGRSTERPGPFSYGAQTDPPEVARHSYDDSRYTGQPPRWQDRDRSAADADQPGPARLGALPPVSGPPGPGAPVSGPPVSGPPVSGPPVSGPPVSGPPVSGPPVSGPPVSGPPVSGPPVSGPPVSAPPAGAAGFEAPPRFRALPGGYDQSATDPAAPERPAPRQPAPHPTEQPPRWGAPQAGWGGREPSYDEPEPDAPSGGSDAWSSSWAPPWATENLEPGPAPQPGDDWSPSWSDRLEPFAPGPAEHPGADRPGPDLGGPRDRVGPDLGGPRDRVGPDLGVPRDRVGPDLGGPYDRVGPDLGGSVDRRLRSVPASPTDSSAAPPRDRSEPSTPERSSPERSSPERSSPERSSPERSTPERSTRDFVGREQDELEPTERGQSSSGQGGSGQFGSGQFGSGQGGREQVGTREQAADPSGGRETLGERPTRPAWADAPALYDRTTRPRPEDSAPPARPQWRPIAPTYATGSDATAHQPAASTRANPPAQVDPAHPYRPVDPDAASAADLADPLFDALPQRVPAVPDVPTVPGPPVVEPPAETPELARIATHLRREEGPSQVRERPEGFDVNAILAAVRGVPGVRDASLRPTPAGAHSLRLDLADGADPAEVSRQVARLLQDRMGLAAAPQNVPGMPVLPGMSGAPLADADADSGGYGDAEVRSGTEPTERTQAATRPARPGPIPAQSTGERTAQPSAGIAPPATAPAAAPAEVPRRRRQQPGSQGQSTVDERRAEPPGLGSPPPGVGPTTAGTSYSGGQITTTEAAPSRPLPSGETPGPRVVIDHVQVSTFGLDATVEVRLAAGDRPATGLATGPAVDGYVLRLCAVSAAAAVDELLRSSAQIAGRGRCFVEHAAVIPFGSCEVATVVVLLVCDGWVEQLAGSALVAGDPRQAVVRATLAAVNRRLEALLA